MPISLPPPSSFREEIYIPRLKTEFEANYIHIRERVTRPRRKFILGYGPLTESEYSEIEELFLENAGKEMTFVHPIKQTVHTVVFADNSLVSEVVAYGVRRLEVTLEEI